MEWDPGLLEMLDKAIEQNVPPFMRAEARRMFIQEAEEHALERGSEKVEELDLIVIAYQATPPDKVAVMEETYKKMGVDIDAYKAQNIV
ncbi:MAG: hypothetical protein JXA42_11275 [Anaerolineales bacterium]|nr:hypothetical protein [Anaerolineales bacterium]